jgi:hypothetical protein
MAAEPWVAEERIRRQAQLIEALHDECKFFRWEAIPANEMS